MISSNPRCALAVLCSALLAWSTVQAQFAYSAFTDGAVANLSLTGRGVNFARGNPAALPFALNGRQVSFALEGSQPHLELPLVSYGYGLTFSLNSRFTLAIGQWDGTATTDAVALKSQPVDDTSPLDYVTFNYRQKWSAGLSYRAADDLAVGIVMRHEAYSFIPWPSRELGGVLDYRTFDLGLHRSGNRITYGVVLRNFVRETRGSRTLQEITRRTNDGVVVTWNPADFAGIRFEPKSSVEAGIGWQVNARMQLLADFSSEKEYALGILVKPLAQLALTAGRGERYDRIYDKMAVRYGALGAQFEHDNVALALTWIVPARRGREHKIGTSEGNYAVRQETNHQLLLGVALSFNK